MKSRKIFLTLEVVTDLPVAVFKRGRGKNWSIHDESGAIASFKVEQVQVNVAKALRSD